jgi:hypothetical protein
MSAAGRQLCDFDSLVLDGDDRCVELPAIDLDSHVVVDVEVGDRLRRHVRMSLGLLSTGHGTPEGATYAVQDREAMIRSSRRRSQTTGMPPAGMPKSRPLWRRQGLMPWERGR